MRMTINERWASLEKELRASTSEASEEAISTICVAFYQGYVEGVDSMLRVVDHARTHSGDPEDITRWLKGIRTEYEMFKQERLIG